MQHRSHPPAVADHGDGSVLCRCHNVPRWRVIAEIRRGARSVQEISARCGAGTGCGSCRDDIDALLSQLGGPRPDLAPHRPATRQSR